MMIYLHVYILLVASFFGSWCLGSVRLHCEAYGMARGVLVGLVHMVYDAEEGNN